MRGVLATSMHSNRRLFRSEMQSGMVVRSADTISSSNMLYCVAVKPLDFDQARELVDAGTYFLL